MPPPREPQVDSAPSQPTATDTTGTPPNEVPTMTPAEAEAEAQAQNPDAPQVDYYLYKPSPDEEPTGMFRHVTTPDAGMRFDRVDKDGKWIEDNSLLGDIAPIVDDESDWDATYPADEMTAREVYDQHFGEAAQGQGGLPPTETQQSQPASGQPTPPTFGATKKGAPRSDGALAVLDNTSVLSRRQVKLVEALCGVEGLLDHPDETEVTQEDVLIEVEEPEPFYSGLDMTRWVTVRDYAEGGLTPFRR